MKLAVIAVVGVVLVSGWVEDKRSCERQAIRSTLHAYMLSAADARWHSYLHERKTNAVQAAIDLKAVRAWRANAQAVQPLDCGGLLPDTR